MKASPKSSIVSTAAFDALVARKETLLTTTQVGEAIGRKPDFVRALVENGRLHAFAFSAAGKRVSYRITRQSVILYLAETADHDAADFPQRIQALLAFLNPEQLASIASAIARLLA